MAINLAAAKEKAKTIFFNVVIPLGLVYLMIEVFGKIYGVLGIILFLLCLAVLALWRGRAYFMTALRSIETMIYGKPLDREYWEKGELSNLWNKKLELVEDLKEKLEKIRNKNEN